METHQLERFFQIGPLQLVIQVVQNRYTREQGTHWDKTNKRAYIIQNVNFHCLSSLISHALLHGGFIPHEWASCEGPIRQHFCNSQT